MGIGSSPRIAAALTVLAVALPATGCSDDDNGSVEGPRTLEIPEESGGSQALTAQPVEGDDLQGISFEAYDESMEEILYLLDAYWAEELPASFDTEYSSPSDVVAYYPGEDDHTCAGERLGAGNAYYCPADDTISWDEPGLMIPFYAEVGDAAVGFVLAHEWGHLVQNRLEAEFPLTIEQELNADCLAGVFAGALRDEGLLDGGESLEPGTDLAEAAEGIFLFGDHPSVPWQDPQAHGTGKQRLRAFAIGYDGGAEACARKLGPGFTDEL